MSYWVSLHNPGTAELATVEIFKEGGIYDLQCLSVCCLKILRKKT